MANLFYSLPIELTREIYDFDPTYKDILDMSLRLIDHCMPKCTCGGKIATVTAPFFYRAYGNSFCLKHDLRGLVNSNTEYDEEPADFITEYGNFSVESFNEFQTLLQSGESFTFNNNGYEISIEFKTHYQYEHDQMIFRIFWYLCCSFWGVDIPQKSIKIINNKKRRQGRFMDMGHYQRREV
jgi:hypothetical protein